VDRDTVERGIQELVRLAHGGDGAAIRAAFHTLVPEATLAVASDGAEGPSASKPVPEPSPKQEGAVVSPLLASAR
jgi:hypothetical protein